MNCEQVIVQKQCVNAFITFKLEIYDVKIAVKKKQYQCKNV